MRLLKCLSRGWTNTWDQPYVAFCWHSRGDTDVLKRSLYIGLAYSSTTRSSGPAETISLLTKYVIGCVVRSFRSGITIQRPLHDTRGPPIPHIDAL